MLLLFSMFNSLTVKHMCVFACTFVGGLMWVCACVFSYINSDEHNFGQLSG